MATKGGFGSLLVLRKYATKSYAEVPRKKYMLPSIGPLWSFVAAGSTQGLHKYAERLHGELGPVFECKIGPVKCLFINEPDTIREVLMSLQGKYPEHITPDPWLEYNRERACKRGLLFMEGEQWHHHRRLINGMILGAKADDWMMKPIQEVITDVTDTWMAQAPFVPNIHHEISRIAVEVMVALTFGSNYEKHKAKYTKQVAQMVEETYMIFRCTANMLTFPTSVYKTLNTKSWRQFVQAIENSITLGDEIVSDIFQQDDKGNGLVEKLMNEGLDKEWILRILIDFITAAGDTTSNTFQWILYSITTNPEVVETYRSMKDDDEEKAKRYVRFIIKESMRLCSVVPFISRILPVDSEVGGYMLPAGTTVMMSVYTAGRSGDNFKDPLKFDPMRWDTANKCSDEPRENVVKCAHATLPFGLGSRSCVGQKIAMLEMIELLEKVMTLFDLKLLNKPPVDNRMLLLVGPKEPLKIMFTRVKK